MNVRFFFPLVLSFRWRACEGAGVAQERDEDQRGAVGPGQEHHPQRGFAGTDQGGPGFLRDHAAGALFSLLVHVWYGSGGLVCQLLFGACAYCSMVAREVRLGVKCFREGDVRSCTGGYY